MRRWLPALAVRRPVTVTMLFVAICVLGAISIGRIPLQMMPGGFEFPYVWIWVPYPDATPLETDRQIVRPVEEQLATISGIEELESRASENNASFSLKFHQSVDLDRAYNDVVDRMERVMPDLPDDVRDYGVFRYNPDDEAIAWYGIKLPGDDPDAGALVEEIVQKRIERVDGVGKVDVWGTIPRRVFIDFDRDAVFAHRVDLYALLQRLRGDNFQLSGGRLLDRGQVRYVRSLSRWTSVEEIADTPAGQGVRLRDIAEVGTRLEASANIVHINGDDGVFMGVYKESSANTVDVARRVRAAFEELERDPRLAGFGFFNLFDQGKLVEESIRNLVDAALEGGVVAVLVLLVFLRQVRMTLLIAASIPFSLMLTVTVLYFTGGSLNLLSLLGLMLAVGMVVDNAIVVVENIHRKRRAGASAAEAAIEGTAEVNLAITLSTATTMVVFLPIILMSENAMFSFFLGALGFPVIFALAASLLGALVFTPPGTLLTPVGRGEQEPRWLRWLGDRYLRVLRWVLARPFDTFMVLLATVLLTVFMPMKQVGCTEQAASALADFDIDFRVPGSFSYRERLEVVEAFEQAIAGQREAWHIESWRTRLRAGSTRGNIFIRLKDDEDRPDRATIVRQAHEVLPDLPGVTWELGWSENPQRRGDSFSIHLTGADPEVLEALAAEVARRVEALPGVLSAGDTLDETGLPELRLVLDRPALARYGLSAQQVARTISFAMRGAQLSPFRQGEHELDVLARFRVEDRADLDRLMDFELLSPVTGRPVALRSLAHPVVAQGFGTIRRRNRRTGLQVKVDLAPGARMEQVRQGVEAALDAFAFPTGYGWERGREAFEQAENDRARNLALLLSVTFVFLLMGVLLESFMLPLAILGTIPMAVLGVYWTLFLTGTPLDMMAGVGLVILIGVVVNNGIVLLDLVTVLRHQGMSRTEALLVAGRRRMRPILMTALTTIGGLLPMALGDATFVGIPYAPLGRVVAGGLATATVLTLLVLPFFYVLFDDLRAAAGRALAYVRPGAVRPEAT